MSERNYVLEVLGVRSSFLNWIGELSDEDWESHTDTAVALSCLMQVFDYMSGFEEVESQPFDPEKCIEQLQCLTRHARRFGFELDDDQEVIIARLFPHERAELIHCASRVRQELDTWLATNKNNTDVKDEVFALQNLLKSIEFAKKVEAGDIA